MAVGDKDLVNVNPLSDTGKFAADVRQRLMIMLDKQEKIETELRRLADAAEAERAERETWKAAIKRGVLQILGAVGWVQK